MTVLEDRVFKDIIKIKWGHYRVRRGGRPDPVLRVSLKEAEVRSQTHRDRGLTICKPRRETSEDT